MQSLSGLLQLTDRRLQGPAPTFDRAHILLAFLTIGRSGRIGRDALARNAGLGQGAVRTIFKKLRDEGYADADSTGCYLTNAGTRVYSSLEKKISGPISTGASQLTVGNFQFAVSVRDAGRSVRNGIEQRDSAVKVGAAGATTYAIRGEKFAIPGGSADCEKDFPSRSWGVLRKELSPRNGDAIIVSGAESEISAKLGALSAALTLL